MGLSSGSNFGVAENSKAFVLESIQAAAPAHPQVPFAIFKQAPLRNRHRYREREVLRWMPSIQPAEADGCSGPEISVAVFPQSAHRSFPDDHDCRNS